jgi:hypothetical protein
VSKEEVFVTAFGPSDPSPGERTNPSGEQARRAFHAIDATWLEVEAGRLPYEDGKVIIAEHKQTLRVFVSNAEHLAMVLARSGQVSMLPAIEKLVDDLLYVARQDALQDREGGRRRSAARAATRSGDVLQNSSPRPATTRSSQPKWRSNWSCRTI